MGELQEAWTDSVPVGGCDTSLREPPGEHVEPRRQRLQGTVQDRSRMWVLKCQDMVWCRGAHEDL